MKVRDDYINGDDTVFRTPSKTYTTPSTIPKEVGEKIENVVCSRFEINVSTDVQFTVRGISYHVSVSGKLVPHQDSDAADGILQFTIYSMSASFKKGNVSSEEVYQTAFKAIEQRFAQMFWQPIVISTDSLAKQQQIANNTGQHGPMPGISFNSPQALF